MTNKLWSLYLSNKLHPVQILYGQKGIGKRDLARQLSLQILSQNEQNPEGLSESVVKRQLETGTYPNFLYLNKGDNREIAIDQVKLVHEFLQKSPLIPGWRVILIDAIDDLNRFGANSLLKILEEPPQKTLILMISHHLGKVLPTIRSRAQKVLIDPQQDNSTLDALMPYTHNSHGQATMLDQAGGLDFVQSVQKMMGQAINKRAEQVIATLETMVKDPKKLECLSFLMPQLLYIKAKKNPVDKICWADLYMSVQKFINDSKDSHLDPLQRFLSALLILENNNRYPANMII